MGIVISRVVMCLLLLGLSACATIRPPLEELQVNVKSFRLVPTKSIPDFEITLDILNPNSVSLALRGMSYSASIEGHRVISGVANNIPELVPYGTSEVTLTGGIDLIGSFQLASKLLQNRTSDLPYDLNIKLDAGLLMPNINIHRSGTIIPTR